MDCAGRVGDAHTQVQRPNLDFHLNENQQFSAVGPQAVVAVSWRTLHAGEMRADRLVLGIQGGVRDRDAPPRVE